MAVICLLAANQTRGQVVPVDTAHRSAMDVEMNIVVHVDSTQRGKLSDSEIARAVEDGIRKAFGMSDTGSSTQANPKPAQRRDVNPREERRAAKKAAKNKASKQKKERTQQPERQHASRQPVTPPRQEERSVVDNTHQVTDAQQPSSVNIPPRPDYLKTWDMMQSKRKITRVDRDLMRAVFVPKGQWLVGASFNYQEWDTDNMNLLVLKNMNLEGYTFSGSPYLGYFIKNNIAVGARYNYNRNYVYLGQFDLNLGEDFNISLSDLYYLAHTHEASAFVRTYMSLGRANIFGFFSEIRGTYAYSVGKNTTGTGVDFEGSYSKGHSVQLTFCPGMAAFVTDFLAAEASIGILGLKYSWKDQHTNRIESGQYRTGGANFRFNFLSINLGLTFYL